MSTLFDENGNLDPNAAIGDMGFDVSSVDVTGDNSWGSWFDSIVETVQGATRTAVNAWASETLTDTFKTVDPKTGEVYVQGSRAPTSAANPWIVPALIGAAVIGVALVLKK